MKRIAWMVCAVLILASAWATVSAQTDIRISGQSFVALQAEVIRLKARLWDQLTSVAGDEPLAALQRQSDLIRQGAKLVDAHGDTALVRQFREAGYPVNTFKNK